MAIGRIEVNRHRQDVALRPVAVTQIQDRAGSDVLHLVIGVKGSTFHQAIAIFDVLHRAKRLVLNIAGQLGSHPVCARRRNSSDLAIGIPGVIDNQTRRVGEGA